MDLLKLQCQKDCCTSTLNLCAERSCDFMLNNIPILMQQLLFLTRQFLYFSYHRFIFKMPSLSYRDTEENLKLIISNVVPIYTAQQLEFHWLQIPERLFVLNLKNILNYTEIEIDFNTTLTKVSEI